MTTAVNTPPAQALTVSRQLARAIVDCHPERDPRALVTARRLLMDVAGICLAARHEPYVKAALAAVEQGGVCTVIGSPARMGVEAAAFVNGIAAHGEDFDDTYEGGPVHAGVVIVPALLAAAERHALDGAALLRGIAVGVEVMCRLCAVAPMQVHKAGFHPTAIFGVVGAVAGIGAALRLSEDELVNAFGLSGSMAGGIIEYLADGSWTKRLHPGWAAQSGYRAVRLAQAGFVGPATVFEGTHGLFHGFANTTSGDFPAMLKDFGKHWLWPAIAFKPYACGTMAHPYIDCARALRRQGVDPAAIERIECETAEGIVHRLWEPLAQKASPPNAYAAKFSIPYAIAAGFVLDDAGLEAYTETMVQRADLRDLAARVHYVVDLQNPYPRQFTGHLRVTLKDGSMIEQRQDHFKGGADHPLSDSDLTHKFWANLRYGGVSQQRGEAIQAWLDDLLTGGVVDLQLLRV
ncbi:MmgE/PrpD family protein [Hydrogenophaga sp.]|uniref:MmgE/PrpD family protein n=1 Tax=Hydrogenophaga sp. TaxID=1904254 RepID=UPI0025BE4B76|nr:MmgE/PrpD family protein [Hydrogenophaga sp.]MBT9463301.1 MmgE/PrpD family protein [Hydrogenophaga sp.]